MYLSRIKKYFTYIYEKKIFYNIFTLKYKIKLRQNYAMKNKNYYKKKI